MVGGIQSKQQEVVGLEIEFGKPLFHSMFQLIAHLKMEQYLDMEQKKPSIPIRMVWMIYMVAR